MDYRGVLAGLGNPGPKYHGTRHNTGFLFIDKVLELARRKGEVSEQNGKRFNCELWRVSLDELDGTWLCVKPQTFMNLSGESVQPLLAWHKMDAGDLVVVHDELDLPPGSLRFKRGGGNAGHNGLKSITQQLGTPDFYRLRLGIGRPPVRGDVTGWVLGGMQEKDRALWHQSMDAGLEALSVFAQKGLEACVSFANKKSREILAAAEKQV